MNLKFFFVFAVMLSVIALSPKYSVSQNCGCEDKQLPEVVATVNGVRITRAEVEQKITGTVRNLQKQVIDARNAELELQINSLLLSTEAKKRGVGTTRLLQTEVVAKAPQPTEAEARAYYDANQLLGTSDFVAVKDDIIKHLAFEKQREQARLFAERLRKTAQVKVLAPVTPPTNAADLKRVFAVVNGTPISSADIEAALTPLIYTVQSQVYNLRRDEIDVRINDLLLEAEAKKRGLTAAALLEQEVTNRTPAITDAEAKKFYDENKGRINGPFVNVRVQILSYLREQAANRLQTDFAKRLRQAASLQINVQPPEPPIYRIAVDDQPSKGNPRAAITLVEFTDYQCPACALQHPIMERLVKEYGDRISWVLLDFPLNQHEHAALAAEAAEAAREQGRYWEYISVLYAKQPALTLADLKQYASNLGLDRAKFDAALASGRFGPHIERDRLAGERAGVDSTPAIFINGRRINDRTYEGLKMAIESELKKMAAAIE